MCEGLWFCYQVILVFEFIPIRSPQIRIEYMRCRQVDMIPHLLLKDYFQFRQSSSSVWTTLYSIQVLTIWHGQKFLQMNQICSGIIQLLQHCFVLMIREKPHSTKVVVLENVFLSNFRLHLIILFSTLPKAKSLEYPWLNTAVAYKAVDWTLRLIFKKNLNEVSCFTTNNMWSRWHYCWLSCFSSVFGNNFCSLFSA